MSVYLCAALHSLQYEEPKIPQDSPYPWTQSIYGKDNRILPEKEPAEELDENNQKGLQNIVVKSRYYDRYIEPTMLIALNFLSGYRQKRQEIQENR